MEMLKHHLENFGHQVEISLDGRFKVADTRKIIKNASTGKEEEFSLKDLFLSRKIWESFTASNAIELAFNINRHIISDRKCKRQTDKANIYIVHFFQTHLNSSGGIGTCATTLIQFQHIYGDYVTNGVDDQGNKIELIESYEFKGWKEWQ